MPLRAHDNLPTHSAQDLCGLTADFVALTSAEIVSAEDRVGKFWSGDGSREWMLDDDCLVARHVVPFCGYPWHLWHRIASEVLGEVYDLQDASQIERLTQVRGLFPRDDAAAPQWIALYLTDLATLLERQPHQDSEASQLRRLRVDVLDAGPGLSAPEYYVDAREISRATWESLSPLIFDQAYTDPEGRPFDLIFDRPDLTTGHASGCAFAALHELQTALTECRSEAGEHASFQHDATFDAYTAKLAHTIAVAPAGLALVSGGSNDLFAAAIAFVGQRYPGWCDGYPTSASAGNLRPVPIAWSGKIEIAGLRHAPGEHSLVQGPDELPASYAIYAERDDGSLEWLGTASTLSEATHLKSAIRSVSARRMPAVLAD
ncbi:hypothetical protein PX699_15975 [Sphingobium sp. H39-3-25]|uniref:hypothetical protein n=1 Tax=Sphingobium arseniciresistens TaxID=3030834 RepID=UPI0023B90A03|nr:hypothetical protein [Sphingobium arseniciresistens]